MTNETDVPHIDRLIRLLMLLPDPESSQYRSFWEQVAEEHNVGLDYVQGNIAGPLRQILLSPEKSQFIPRNNLAKYTLFFFGEPSDELVSAITSQIDPGAPNEAVGQMWVQQVRATAFEVVLESASEEQVDRACANWMRTIKTRQG